MIDLTVQNLAAQALLFGVLRFETDGGELVAGPGYRTWRTEADAILSFLLDGS